MNLEHIHPSFRHVIALSDQERIRFLYQDRWVDYSVAEQVMTTMRDLMMRPPADRMPGLLIISDGYNGKTSLLKRFHELYGDGYVNGNAEPVKPIIYTLSKEASEKRLHTSILERFHAPYRTTDSPLKLYYQVLHLCRACHVEMLMIDEIHDLFLGSASAQRNILTTIKHLSNELRIPIVGAGLKEAVRAMHMTDQLATRFEAVRLPLWELNPSFQQLLAGLELTLPLKYQSKLSQPELATAIYRRGHGQRIGNTRMFLQMCAVQAIKSGRERIDLELVEKNKQWTPPSAGMRELIG